jgi:hypothetical protein
MQFKVQNHFGHEYLTNSGNFFLALYVLDSDFGLEENNSLTLPSWRV